MTRAVRPRTLRRIASRERQRGYLGLNSYRRLAASALSGPAFAAGLLTSIVPDKAAPGTAPTFTRATTKTFTDWEGQVRTALAGEACFTGARRVQNTVAGSSFDLSNASYVKRNGHAAAAPDATGLSPITVTTGISGGNQGVFNESLLPAGVAAGTYVFRARAIAGSLSQLAVFIKDRATDTVRASATVNIAGGSGSVISVVATGVTTPAVRVEVNCAAGGSNGTLWLGEWQVECVNGQSNQNPSEYVSVGVLSAPFQGANVDGVQYFATQNGNTVASNVVTAGTGAAIPPTTLLGYDAWQASTNLVLQSEDIATTWTLAQSTIGAATTAPNGAVSAKKIQEDTSTNIHAVAQSVTKAASALPYTVSVYLKQAERTWGAVQLDDGANGQRVYFNLATGVVGTTALIGTGFTSVSATITPAANGFYRVTISSTSTTATTIRTLVMAATADNTGSYAGTLNSGIYAWGAHIEQLAFATPYIATTTAIVTRNADILTYPSAGNADPATGVVYAEINLGTIAVVQGVFALNDGTANNRDDLRSASGTLNGLVTSGGVGQSNVNIGGITPGVTCKVAAEWSAARTIDALNGALSASSSAATAPVGVTTIKVGCLDGSSNQANGTIRNLQIWTRTRSDAELQAMTT